MAKGKTTFNELASFISQAAPTAAGLGVSLEEVLAAVATMTKQGVPTATAMVQIRNAMLGLNKELGDGWAETRTLQQALEEVGAQGGYSASALEKAFGRENISGVLALIGSNAKSAAADLEFMNSPAQSLQDAFDKVSEETKHWAGLLESARAVITNIGEAFDKAIRPAVNKIKDALENWRTNTDFFDKLETQLVKAQGMAQDLWFAVSQGGKGDDLMSGIGQTLRGVATAAGQAVITLLLKAAPLIGHILGTAAKEAMSGLKNNRTDRTQAMQNLKKNNPEQFGDANPNAWFWVMSDEKEKMFNEELKRVQMQRFHREGSTTAEHYMDMFGNSDIAGGLQTISNVAQSGAAGRAAASGGRGGNDNNMQAAATAGQEAAALTAENTGLMRQVFANIKAEQEKQKRMLEDAVSRSKQIGG